MLEACEALEVAPLQEANTREFGISEIPPAGL